jgi:uncharacterized membrane protein
MTAIFVLLALLLFAFGVSLYALSQISALKTRLRALERQIGALHLKSGAAEAPEPEAMPEPEPETELPAVAAVAAEEPAKKSKPPKPKQKEQFGKIKPPAPPAPTFVDRVMDNIIANWIIWLAALSLGLGGVFIVQYGIERGYLGPVARVIAALCFGAILIGVAEYVRRKNPDQAVNYFSAHVALAAGGIASLFAGVVAAHVLYDLTNALVGFASMAVVSWLALAGGLIYGPVLAVIGLLGAYISPFLVASEGPSPLMYLYFLLVLMASLAVERWQRWIWLSSLSVFGALVWGVLLHWSIPNQPYLAGHTIAVILTAVTVPAFGLPPRSGVNGWVTPRSFEKISHHYPTILAVVTALAATLLLVLTSPDSLIFWQSSLIALPVLLVLSVFLFGKAQNLDQIAAIAGLGMIGVVAGIALLPGSEGRWLYGTDYDQVIRRYFPFASLSMLGLTLVYTLGSLWRSPRSVRPFYWNALTALLPLLALVVLWSKWQRTDVLTNGNWQVLALLLTGLLTGLAILHLRRGADMLSSADILSCGAFFGLGFLALLILSPSEQIIGFAALAVLAFVIEARHSLRLLGLVSLGYTSLAFGRIVLDPGIEGGIYGDFLQGPVYIAVATALFYCGAWWATQVKSDARLVQFETAGVAGLGILISVLLGRVAEAGYNLPDHALLGLYVSVWLILSLVQCKRAEQDHGFTRLRLIFGWGYFGLASFAFLVGSFWLDPVIGDGASPVAGFFPLDSIVMAYALPALILFASHRVKYLPAPLPRHIGLPVAGALATWTIILEIRRFWHGNDIYGSDILTPELYSYTVALLIATLACVVAALIRKDNKLRTWGLALAGVTAVKVFVWDMSDLQGLNRATAFIALGLTLAGIAWLFQHFTMEKPSKKKPDA